MNREFNTNLCTNTYGDFLFLCLSFLNSMWFVARTHHHPNRRARAWCTPNIELERIILQIFVLSNTVSFLNNLNWEIYLIDAGRIVFSWLFVVWAWVNSFILVYYWKEMPATITNLIPTIIHICSCWWLFHSKF